MDEGWSEVVIERIVIINDAGSALQLFQNGLPKAKANPLTSIGQTNLSLSYSD